MIMVVYPLGVVGPWELVIIALVVLLLFGGKKIPELMKGLGKGLKSFKEGMNEITETKDDVKTYLDSDPKPKEDADKDSK